MATLDINFPDNFMGGLLDTGFEEIAKEALEEAAPLLENSLKASCRRVLEHGEGSELVNSIKKGKPRRTRTDAWIVKVFSQGYSWTKMYKGARRGRRVRVANALKLMAKEYGVAGRQPARPFLANACNNARNAVMEKMQEVYSKKVGGNGNK